MNECINKEINKIVIKTKKIIRRLSFYLKKKFTVTFLFTNLFVNIWETLYF